MEKAIFLDRDGVVNEMVYYPEHGILDSPFVAAQFRLLPNVPEAIKKFRDAGFKVIIVSNQPGIAKGYLSEATFEEIRYKMHTALEAEGAGLDGEFYCLHHPRARVARLKVECDCRKPGPGLLLQAAEAMDIDLGSSWMVGDGLTDIEAGKRAGCRTVLIGKMKCELCHLMDETGARPDFVVADLLEAARIVGGGDTGRLPAGAGEKSKPGKK
jgi:D-glycero-D-manno-heptose 1,7-bisphosphate phosphatase